VGYAPRSDASVAPQALPRISPRPQESGPDVGISQAVSSGDRVTGLLALRDYLAGLIDSFDGAPKDIAPITKQLADVVRELDELAPVQRKGTALDELAARRSDASGSRRA
jgi:hypothetical protein